MEKEKDFFQEEEVSERGRRTLAILEIIRRKGPLSRMDISKTIGINPVTISNYIDRLISNNFIYEKAFSVSTGGRRPMLLDINSKAGYSIGVGVNLFDAVGVIMDIEGKIIYKYKKDGKLTSVNQIIETVVFIIDSLLGMSSDIKERIKGIGIGIGGIIDKKRGVIRWPQKVNNGCSYSYISMPLKEFLENKFKYPVFIDNDATLACFAEYWLSLDNTIKNMLYMFSGVGVGMILNGEMYAGNDGCAGETFINVDNDHQCMQGDFSILGQWDKDLNLIERSQALVKDKTVVIESLEDIFKASSANLAIRELVYEAARALSVKIGFLVNLLNPEVIVIGGGLEKGGFEFIERINYFVRKYAFEEMTKDLKIIPSSLGEEAVARGAGSLVIKNIFTYI